MVIGIGVGLTLLGNWVPWLGLWVVLGCSSCARDVGLMFWFCLPTPGCGVLLGCFVGCASMWVLSFVVQFYLAVCWLNPYVGD